MVNYIAIKRYHTHTTLTGAFPSQTLILKATNTVQILKPKIWKNLCLTIKEYTEVFYSSLLMFWITTTSVNNANLNCFTCLRALEDLQK